MTDPYRQAVFAPGVMIGERYRLVSIVAIDRAGNEFWQARDTVLPRDMAVTLMPGVEHTAATVTRTLRAGRLQHPGLPSVLDMGSAATRSGASAAYIVGPWTDGAPLTDVLSAGPLEPTVAAALTAKVTDAVDEVHSHGLALGALPPALVRINSEGQARLSHVIARSDATTQQDIRAAGALLYVMLTAAWPLEDDSGIGSLLLAPVENNRELPATRMNPAVPQALSTLADRAMHPEGRQGIHAIGAMTTLLSPQGPRPAGGHGRGSGGAGGMGGYPLAGAGVGAAAGSGTTGEDGARPAGADESSRRAGPEGREGRRSAGGAHHQGRRGSQARRSEAPVHARGEAPPTLVRERRIKLGIAGGMMTVLAVLIIIIAATVVKQFLAGIAEPIKQIDSQEVIDTTVPTTTRTVGSTPTTTAGSAPSSSTSGSPATTSASSTPPKEIPVANAIVYDPQGTPPKDYEAYIDRAFDDDPGTYWLTWVYKQQFGRAEGGLKDGVGLLMTFKDAITPSSVTVSTSTPGTTVEIRSADSADPALDSTKVLGSASLESDPVNITLSSAPKSKYLIVWVSKLAPYQGDSAKNKGQFQSNITEIAVMGS